MNDTLDAQSGQGAGRAGGGALTWPTCTSLSGLTMATPTHPSRDNCITTNGRFTGSRQISSPDVPRSYCEDLPEDARGSFAAAFLVSL